MSLLDGLVGQIIKNSLSNTTQPQNQDMLGGLLGSVLGNQAPQAQSGLGGLIGSVVANQFGNQQPNTGLGGVLGSLLGGQKSNAGDLGNVLAQVLGAKQDGFNKNTLLIALIPIVLTFIQKNGGLSGLLNKFNVNGLSAQAQSWVNIDQDGDGIDAGDVMRLFGHDEIQQACQQTGASQDDVCQGIAELLPKVINDLTPTGNLHADEHVANQEISQILTQFGKAL